jgi:hypothetical protein
MKYKDFLNTIEQFIKNDPSLAHVEYIEAYRDVLDQNRDSKRALALCRPKDQTKEAKFDFVVSLNYDSNDESLTYVKFHVYQKNCNYMDKFILGLRLLVPDNDFEIDIQNI